MQKQTEQLIKKSFKIDSNLHLNTKTVVIREKEKDASSWLTMLPIEGHGFTLTRNELKDVIYSYYNKTFEKSHRKYPCG